MDFFDLIAQRESCRNYDPDRPVEREKLEKCVEAGRIAPSARNSQPWRFLVVTSPEGVAAVRRSVQMAGANKFTDSAPAFIVIEEDRDLITTVVSPVKRMDFVPTDLGIAAAHIALAATAQGLSTCIIGWLDPGLMQKELDLPANKPVRLVLSVGYSADASLRPKKRRGPDDVIRWL